MKKVLKTLLIIFVVIVILVSALCVWQWKNIKSIIKGVEEDSASIEKSRNENQEVLVVDVNAFMDNPIREMTVEEIEQINRGEITVTDVYQKIFEEKQTETQPQAAKKPTRTKDSIISKYMAELYKLQNEYTALAETTIKSGASYYESIKKHPQDKSARAATITHFTPIVRKIESECNAKVEAVIKNMKTELEAIGEDTSITETVRKTYEKEKQLKLSYYANKYLK